MSSHADGLGSVRTTIGIVAFARLLRSVLKMSAFNECIVMPSVLLHNGPSSCSAATLEFYHARE